VLALVFGAALGLAMRQVMGVRARLGWAEAVLSGILGAALGALLVSLLLDYRNQHWLLVVLASVLSTVLVMLVVGYLTRQPRPSAAELIAAGESAHVEFKSTGRCNLHTGTRDDKIELVISKTVSAFANGKGGDLLIGVDDSGTALGLDEDLKFMKSPDLDRYELWLRDHLTKTIGAPATAGVEVSFPNVEGRAVCHVRVAASLRPVFLSTKGQPAQMWVRVGNSTRQLAVDEALHYSADRWGRRRLR
jgi:uncharacterized membrane protein YeaQ/YmgE (transglycosylase-associated protein family)